MKLREYTKALQELVKTNGDLELIHSSDDEGNSFHPVQCGPEKLYVKKLEHYMELVRGEEDKEDGDIEVICIN